jgi:hypothetical protein
VVRGVTSIIMLHTLRRGEMELSPSLEFESYSLDDSSRMACRMVTCYVSCPQTQCRSWPPFGDRPRMLKRLAGILRELDVEQKMCVAGSDGGFT